VGIRCSTASEVIARVKSGQRIFVHGGAATPQLLLTALMEKSRELSGIELMHIHTEGSGNYAQPQFGFRIANLFVGKNLRPHFDRNRVDYLPCFLSEIPQLLRSKKRPIDVAIIHVSPPDKHGFCTLGTSVDVAKAAVGVAPIIIAQINKQMPWVHGDGFIHISHIDAYIEVDEPLPQIISPPPTAEERAIGKFIAGLVENGSTIQMGIGSVPDAVAAELVNHRHLGVHTEMWSNGILSLIKSGAVDNSQKAFHVGKTVSGFVIGSRELYDFIHDNPSIIQLDIEYVNNPAIIARNPKVVAINSAVEIDLTGQVCADSLGSRIISGVGGQMDFMRGAALSKGGKPIIAVTSRTKRGKSRIVPNLTAGAGVVTTRAHVHHVVTEYGVVDLFGKTLNERAKALIALAHPEDRESLSKAWNS
jgi:4-hydroxybutyrate CoA-transferase